MKMNTPLVCGSCKACCVWGDNNLVLAPVLTQAEVEGHEGYQCHQASDGTWRLDATAAGSCVYLGENGCNIHPTRPRACRAFDCRTLYDSIEEIGNTHTLLRVLVQGGLRSIKL